MTHSTIDNLIPIHSDRRHPASLFWAVSLTFVCFQQLFVQPGSPNSIPVIKGMECGAERRELYCNTTNFVGNALHLFSSQHLPYRTDGSTVRPYFQKLSQYKVIDLMFDGGRLNISNGFFDSLSELFGSGGDTFSDSMSTLQTPHEYKFRVKFQNFRYLHLDSKIFNNVFQNLANDAQRHLTLNVYNSREGPFSVSNDLFDGIDVSRLTVHNTDLSQYVFETLFKHATVKQLNLQGTYIMTDPHQKFTGNVDKVVLTKQASRLSSDEFPKFPVKVYVINAQNIQSVDGSSFHDYHNLNDLNIKSELLRVDPGDFDGLQSVERLALDNVFLKPGVLQGMRSLKELSVKRPPVRSMELLSEIAKLPNLKSLDWDDTTLQNDVRKMCDLITQMSQAGNILGVSVPVESPEQCNCEHKFLARLKNSQESLCYHFQGECNVTGCALVDDYFSGVEKLDEESVLDLDSKLVTQVQDRYTDDVDQDRSMRNTTDETDHVSSSSSTQQSVNDSNWMAMSISDEDNQDIMHPMAVDGKVSDGDKRSHSKLNWLPIAVVAGILSLILVIGIIAYLVRFQRDKHREFKPIPSSEVGQQQMGKAGRK